MTSVTSVVSPFVSDCSLFMRHRVKRLAVALRDLGVRPGDRVATLAWNHHQHLESYFAITAIGAVLHTLNLRLHANDLSYIINHAGDRVLIVDEGLLSLVEQCRSRVSLQQTSFSSPSCATGSRTTPYGSAFHIMQGWKPDPGATATGCVFQPAKGDPMRMRFSAVFGRRATVTTCALAAAIGLVWLAAIPVAGQGTRWTPPRTSWGDPDLQGTYTNTYENGTSFERPNEFAGRRLEDITGEELAAMRRAIQKRTIANFEGPIHAPDNWWQDNLFLDRGSQAWFVVDPPDGKIPPLTVEAGERQAARASARRNSGRGPADSFEDRSLYDRCISRGLPGSMLPAIYGNQYQIVQSPGYVAILYEMIHEARIIPVSDGPHLGEHIRAHMGDGRGRWEGDTLVVETTNFRDESVYRGANAAKLRLIERFTRVSPDKVRWAVTVDDPSTWTKPWTFAMPLTRDSTPLPAYECHEGNYGLRNILSAARAEEKRATETTIPNNITSGR